MTSALSLPSSGARSDLARKAALCAVLGPALFAVAWTVLGFVSPGFTVFGTAIHPYSALSHPVSGLGLGITAPFMNGAFVISGALLVVGVVGVFSVLEEVRGLARWAAGLLLAMTGVGSIVDGVFSLDAMLPHFVGYALGCGTPALGFLVTGLVVRRLPGWRTFGNALLAASPVTLALFVLDLAAFDPEAAAAGRGFAGLSERVLILEVHFWFAALGWRAFRSPRAPHVTTRTGEAGA